VAADIPVIVNARSGTGGTADVAIAISAAFEARGLHANVSVLPADDIAATVDRLVAEGATLIVAGGGDGTINLVAAGMVDKEATLGVLPLGTLNHFARDLGIAFDIDAAVRVIAENHSVVVDAGEVNGRIFLNNSSMGLYPRIVADREHARKHLGLGKWPALARATWLALRDPYSFNAIVCVDGKDLQRRTPFIFVGNNSYVLEGFGIGQRARLDAGVLSLYVLRSKSTMGLLWLGFRALLGIGSQRRDFDSLEATEFHVESQHPNIEVATDGELADLPTPVRYRIRPGALRVLAPRPETPDVNS
jgi:diacylglycerol kinase family enzyme